MKRLLYIVMLVLVPLVMRAEKKSVPHHIEQRIAACKSYVHLFYVSCDNDTSLCLIDSLNLLSGNADLHRLFKHGNSIQRTAAFVLICTRTANHKVRRKALEQIISDTTRYDYFWSDDIMSEMPVGGYCFSWARQQGWATNEQYAEYVKGWGEYDTWESYTKKLYVPDERGLFTKPWIGWFSTTMPEFPGGREALFDFIKENMRYPEEARKAGKEGRTICQFRVMEDGSLQDVEVVRSSGDESLDAEAIRLISIMPTWIPGKQCNRAIAVKYTVPFIFKLE